MISQKEILDVDEEKYIDNSNKFISSRSEALKLAWLEYKDNHSEGITHTLKKDTPKVKIGNKYVGEGEPIFIIAEIGINHNGDIKLAKKLIDVAIEAGCDAVKFQKRTVEDVIKCSKLSN